MLEEVVGVAFVLVHRLHLPRVQRVRLDRVELQDAIGAAEPEGIRVEHGLEVLLVEEADTLLHDAVLEAAVVELHLELRELGELLVLDVGTLELLLL